MNLHELALTCSPGSKAALGLLSYVLCQHKLHACASKAYELAFDMASTPMTTYLHDSGGPPSMLLYRSLPTSLMSFNWLGSLTAFIFCHRHLLTLTSLCLE